MNGQFLKNKVAEIQRQYLELLKQVYVLFENEKDTSIALDNIEIFWKRRKKIIHLYLYYFVRNNNAVFYSASACFDLKKGEQYPFLLMGDIHIFDDPLGEYCKMCRLGYAPGGMLKRVKKCVEKNIEILEKYEDVIVILPLRSMRTSEEEKDFLEIGERIILDFFSDIYSMDRYYEICKSSEDIVRYFKSEYVDKVCLYANDSYDISFSERINNAISIIKQIKGEGYTNGEYFYFALLGPIMQALDILLVCAEYEIIPIVSYSVCLHYVQLLLLNFTSINTNIFRCKLTVFNMVYYSFDKSVVTNITLEDFCENAKSFEFENKALECYSEKNLAEMNISIINLIKEFEDCLKQTN
ncbi:hypothetical protein SAMN02745111_00706 [Eubacterium uniforme]|uniref:Uncharacterized protein n=1 Tax=Eubacterium uniforme TaxID=39495 RepID=A0A1T4VCX6_9FIRM|nr:hypothetical protein [Eubacterium uniforme]SKA62815.1 hypothetical protein SAMN02745111_00706 [Eubacterium uniforme]